MRAKQTSAVTTDKKPDMTANILVYDVGSTYTKASAFRLEGDDLHFLEHGQSPTTLENVMDGVDFARAQIEQNNVSIAAEARTYATCSAAGGLRMVALGYMPRVTAKAAKEVAMTAGARVMEVISFDESPEYRQEVLQEIRPDIILLAGGTDGGDQESVLENVDIIIRSRSKAWVIIACNADVQEQAAARLTAKGIECVRVPNIMPTIHELNVKPAREAIHTQFIRQITRAKGLPQLVAGLTDQKVVPTPGAVLLASELLARGTHTQEGIGGLLLIDLGGATTDIHSALPELEKLKPEERGLIINNEKQFSYRTVEGNLGLRVSALGIVDTVGPEAIIQAMPAPSYPTGAAAADSAAENPWGVTKEDIQAYAQRLEQNTKWIPANEREKAIDEAMSICAVAVALRRHAGHIAQVADPVLGLAAGSIVGRDLRLVEHVLAVGGIFSHSDTAQRVRIIRGALADPGISLLPTAPNLYFDDKYILYALGALSQYYPEAVFKFLKERYLSNSI